MSNEQPSDADIARLASRIASTAKVIQRVRGCSEKEAVERAISAMEPYEPPDTSIASSEPVAYRISREKKVFGVDLRESFGEFYAGTKAIADEYASKGWTVLPLYASLPQPAVVEVSLPELPGADIRVTAFGEVEPYDQRPFVMGDFYTADQLHARDASILAAVSKAMGVEVKGKAT